MGHGKFRAVDDNTNSQFRFVFRHHRYNRWKDKIISTIQELEFKYLIVSGGLSEDMSVDFINK
jgi:6-phosphofructokinase 2